MIMFKNMNAEKRWEDFIQSELYDSLSEDAQIALDILQDKNPTKAEEIQRNCFIASCALHLEDPESEFETIPDNISNSYLDILVSNLEELGIPVHQIGIEEDMDFDFSSAEKEFGLSYNDFLESEEQEKRDFLNSDAFDK